MQKAGLTLVYEPGAIDYHWHPVPYDEQKQKMELAGRSTVRFYRKHPTFGVQTKLGMTPVSLALHGIVRKRAEVARVARAHRRARSPGLARNIVYQYHYLNGVRDALERS